MLLRIKSDGGGEEESGSASGGGTALGDSLDEEMSCDTEAADLKHRSTLCALVGVFAATFWLQRAFFAVHAGCKMSLKFDREKWRSMGPAPLWVVPDMNPWS